MEIQDALIDALPGLVWIARGDGHAEFLNARWCEYTGLTPEQAFGDGWLVAVHPEDRPHLIACWGRFIATGSGGEAEARLRRHDGQYRWFQFSAAPLTDAAGQVTRWCGVNTDIEDRRRAEEKLKASERRARGILDGLPAMVTLMTAEGELEHGNQVMLNYFGKTLEELKARPVGFSFHPDDRAEVLARWQYSVVTGEPYDHEARLRRADGVYRWFHTVGYPLRDAAGRILVWYMLQADIDERRRAEALLAGEKLLLEKVARGLPQAQVLGELAAFVDTLATDCACSILLVEDGGRLKVGAGPNLPDAYNGSVEGRALLAGDGPWFEAAVAGSPKLFTDLASCGWAAADWLAPLAARGLRSCWATPIQASDGRALAVLVVYSPDAEGPSAGERERIDRLRNIAAISIERSAADAALKASEADLRVAISHLNEAQRLSKTGSFTWDVAIDQHNWSEQILRTFGFAPDTRVTLDTITAAIHPDDRAGVEAILTEGVKRESFELVFRINTPDGVRHAHVVGRRLRDIPDRPVFIGALQDVTRSRVAEEELRRSEAHLAEAQRLSQTGSFTWDFLGDHSTWSDEMYRIFEVEPGTSIRIQIVKDRFHPDDLPLLAGLLDGIEDRTDFDFSCRLITTSGRLKYIHSVGRRISNPGEKPIFVGALQDITARKLAEEGMDRARAELAHVSRVTTVGSLTTAIAHEVNQPLAGIVANASTCLRALDMDPPKLELCRTTAQRMIRDANRASDVIRRLRGLFTRKPPSVEAVDLSEAAREVLALCAIELQTGRVLLRTEFASNLPPTLGDRVQLQQVILNLLLNAVDAMSGLTDRSRELVVSTGMAPLHQVQLSVRDSGVGFAPEEMERLFDPFYTTKPQGMGVGLSVCRSIIERHDGRIWASANAGPGATFTFTLPADKAPPDASASDGRRRSGSENAGAA